MFRATLQDVTFRPMPCSGVLPPRYRVTRPSGTPWTRTFATAQAAWRVVVGGCNSEREWRARKAGMVMAGWRVARLP